jgi:RibD domain-containing protein
VFVRQIRYAVAMSLDGYIAGPKGEAGWIIMDPDIDFRAVFEQFDGVLLGRRTFEAMARGGTTGMPGMKTFVFSRTLRQLDYPDVAIVAEKSEGNVGHASGEVGEGHLVIRWRLAVSRSRRRKACGHGGGRSDPGTSGRRNSAASTPGQAGYKTGIVSLEYAVMLDRDSQERLFPQPSALAQPTLSSTSRASPPKQVSQTRWTDL